MDALQFETGDRYLLGVWDASFLLDMSGGTVKVKEAMQLWASLKLTSARMPPLLINGPFQASFCNHMNHNQTPRNIVEAETFQIS